MSLLVQTFSDVKYKVLRLELLNAEKKCIANASGFITSGLRYQNNKDDIVEGTFLWTTWHAVTGISPREPEFTEPPERRFLRVSGQGIQIQNRPASQTQSGQVALGGSATFTIPLYRDDESPVWLQERYHKENLDLNAIGIHVPGTYDVVLIPINLPTLYLNLWSIHPQQIKYPRELSLGMDVFVAGYPHGYSIWDDSPFPTFLKRNIAITAPYNGRWQVNSPAAAGMSGGPVFLLQDQQTWKLSGLYYGSDYPDYDEDSKAENDKFASLGGFFDSMDMIYKLGLNPRRSGGAPGDMPPLDVEIELDGKPNAYFTLPN